MIDYNDKVPSKVDNNKKYIDFSLGKSHLSTVTEFNKYICLRNNLL